MRISKWGNSLAIRLPAAIVEALNLHEGDDVVLRAAGKRTLVIENGPSAKELLARLRRFRGRCQRSFKFPHLRSLRIPHPPARSSVNRGGGFL
ncbi:AbrB/MazE/SpoVT family DNA-binding domain-containing protein [Peristeroidobacter agariperforans]|uniref:AbrB/MazE/SpoVT family DNA-binding domain-containing protein n=1 Tax=Peristeroidobacter agariperforans TaxID=268404 RepID=UPI00101C7A74|nr:AbrB/MazE/SpoVT family DNA-binding domain-containing protein [Peristeroidobacter agariperforans]